MKKERLQKNDNEEFNPKLINFKFDLKDARYELDALQEEMLKFYIKNDLKFRRAFHTNFTSAFLKFIEDKVKLQEPFQISTIGSVRSGKSVSMQSICIYHQALQGRLFTIDYICANEFEFLEKVKDMDIEKLKGRIFLVDEEKQSTWGTGSIARRTKMEDVSNIIAKANISTIRICPTRFPMSETAWYGLRSFGRCFKTHTCRFMLYNLQEGNNHRPMGMIYLPIADYFLPEKYAKKLSDAYLKKKSDWIERERRGEMDVMLELRRKLAHSFARDEQYKELTSKDERISYITAKLGSEYTTGEIYEIMTLAKMLMRGIELPNDK